MYGRNSGSMPRGDATHVRRTWLAVFGGRTCLPPLPYLPQQYVPPRTYAPRPVGLFVALLSPTANVHNYCRSSSGPHRWCCLPRCDAPPRSHRWRYRSPPRKRTAPAAPLPGHASKPAGCGLRMRSTPPKPTAKYAYGHTEARVKRFT